MSNWTLILLIVLTLTALGTLTLVFITVKFYWGARGTPPLVGDARKIQKQEELRQRAAQIEHSKKNPIKKYSRTFWDKDNNSD